MERDEANSCTSFENEQNATKTEIGTRCPREKSRKKESLTGALKNEVII